MAASLADPGYGDPNAPIGSAEWAKRWRLCFQGAVKQLPSAPSAARAFLVQGNQHRAWTLVTDEAGRPFPDFDTFCAHRQPWGLGMDPVKFRTYLAGELGPKLADLVTVAPGQQGERTDLNETSRHGVGKSEADQRKEQRLRAILRAPESVQALYRDGLITQATACKLGPKSPTPEQAAKVEVARRDLEQLDRTRPAATVRKQAKEVVARHLGGSKQQTGLDRLRAAWRKASTDERAAFLAEVANTLEGT